MTLNPKTPTSVEPDSFIMNQRRLCARFAKCQASSVAFKYQTDNDLKVFFHRIIQLGLATAT